MSKSNAEELITSVEFIAWLIMFYNGAPSWALGLLGLHIATGTAASIYYAWKETFGKKVTK